MRHLTDPRVSDLGTENFVAMGHRLLDDGFVREGRFVFILVGDYHPASASAQVGWGRAMELEEDLDAAIRHYERALALEPDHAVARQALARLQPTIDHGD